MKTKLASTLTVLALIAGLGLSPARAVDNMTSVSYTHLTLPTILRV